MPPSSSSSSSSSTASHGRRPRSLADRAFLWFARTEREMPEVRRAMLATLAEPVRVTVLASFWSLAVACVAWSLLRQWWALGWMAAEVVLFVLRVACSHRIAKAEPLGGRLPVRWVFVLHGAWMLLIAAGSALTVCESDLRIVFLGVMMSVGFCGYVVSRWQAFPRCALAFIHCLWLGLFLGLLDSPLQQLRDIAWLTPAGGLAFQVLLGLNHAIVVGALRAQQENRRLSMHDPLTELPNRLMLRERLAALCRRQGVRRMPEPFAVLCLDLDGFKSINDRHGHAAGDWLLKSVAAGLRGALRGQDLACRVGGDEFVVLLPGADEAGAIDTAERLLATVARLHDLGGAAIVAGRTSVGIALAPRDGVEPEALLAAADAALYAAKRAGKGRWQVHGHPHPAGRAAAA